MSMQYVFDGSLNGLLCSIFEWFERKPGKIELVTSAWHQPDAFRQTLIVNSNRTRAERVWKGLAKKLGKDWQRRFYCCFLSEMPEAYIALFEFACHVFQSPAGTEEDYGHPAVLTVAKFARSVEREKHRMEAFIRFKRTKDGVFYSTVSPDFNVLPLINKHFKDRYADQCWIIYDLRRKYGLFYDLTSVQEVVFDHPKVDLNTTSDLLDEEEKMFSSLWQGYFKSANIAARKNTKLHIRHVPKRYWRYLTEKAFSG